MKQDYITDDERNFIINCKLKLRAVIKAEGWTVEALSLDNGIPSSTIYSWLDVNQLTFPLPGICVLCRSMKIPVHSVLADPMWNSIDKDRYLFVRPWMEEPIENVRAFTDFYYKCKAIFSRAE
jgi:hypothetical protein